MEGYLRLSDVLPTTGDLSKEVDTIGMPECLSPELVRMVCKESSSSVGLDRVEGRVAQHCHIPAAAVLANKGVALAIL